MKFITMLEHNDWEGETWKFYLPWDGNEAAIEKLIELLREDESYTFDRTLLSEKQVDARARRSAHGYMAYHNKCMGKLDLGVLSALSEEELFPRIYKGEIRTLFQEET